LASDALIVVDDRILKVPSDCTVFINSRHSQERTPGSFAISDAGQCSTSGMRWWINGKRQAFGLVSMIVQV
jgi:hypothetical protein